MYVQDVRGGSRTFKIESSNLIDGMILYQCKIQTVQQTLRLELHVVSPTTLIIVYLQNCCDSSRATTL